MKSLCLILLIALSMPGCSSFSKSARQQRAYEKYLKKSMTARERQRRKIIQKQRAELPTLRNSPLPQEQQTAEQPLQPAPETQ
jgi:uncharacterized protein YceK